MCPNTLGIFGCVLLHCSGNATEAHCIRQAVFRAAGGWDQGYIYMYIYIYITVYIYILHRSI